MDDYTALNLVDIYILCWLCLLTTMAWLRAFTTTVGPVAEDVSGRWVGRRVPKQGSSNLLRPMQIIELDLPDGSTTRVSTGSFRLGIAPPALAGGRVEDLCLTRLSPGILTSRARRNARQISYPLYALFSLAWANYFIASAMQYKMPPMVYGIEAALFIGAILIGFGNASRARNTSWDDYRQKTTQREERLDTKFGPVDPAATSYDPDLFQNDIRLAAKEKNPLLVLLCLILFILPPAAFMLYHDWKDSLVLFENTSYAQATVTSVQKRDHDYYESCDLKVKFLASDVTPTPKTDPVMFRYLAPGTKVGHPIVHNMLHASIFTPYCHIGDQLTVAYNRKNILRSKPAVYAGGWNLYGLIIETLFTLLLFYALFKRTFKKLRQRREDTVPPPAERL